MSQFDGQQDDAPVNLPEVFNGAWQHYKAQAKFFISVSLVYALLSEGAGFLITRLSAQTQQQLFLKSVVNIVFACWASIAIIFAASCLARNRKFSVEHALALARQRYGLYLCVYLAMLGMVIFGFLLFVVPGLYFMTIFLFADILVVVDHVGFTQAFVRSARMVRPFFWKVFIYLFIIVGISLTPEVVYQLGMKMNLPSAIALQKVAAVLIMPFLMIAQVELFYAVRRQFKFDLSQLDGPTEPNQYDAQ
jgi:hypothetical protein